MDISSLTNAVPMPKPAAISPNPPNANVAVVNVSVNNPPENLPPYTVQPMVQAAIPGQTSSYVAQIPASEIPLVNTTLANSNPLTQVIPTTNSIPEAIPNINQTVTLEPLPEENAHLISQQIPIIQTNSGVNTTTTQPVTYHNPDVDSNNAAHVKVSGVKPKSSIGGLIKLILIILIPLGVAGITGVVIAGNAKEKAYQREKEVLISVPMKNVNWQDLGNVFEPVITIPVKTSSSFENWEFLIDSGAVISSLPNDWAQKTGQDLAFLKRSTFRGFGGKTSLAYQGEMKLQLGEEEVALPVVFTEATGTKSLLGRKGFFENYSLFFNHIDKQIEIRK